MIKLATKIGKVTVQCEFNVMSDVHKFMGIYGSVPEKCDNCQSDNIYPSHMAPGGNDYFTMQCGSCGASCNFGQKKDGRGLYWKNDKMTVYTGDGQNSSPSGPPANDNSSNPNF